VRISTAEIAYLCNGASEYFARPVRPEDVVWSYSGVRPLYDDGASAAQEATRDYVLTLDAPDGQPALLNVFGGKITTYRRLAETALAKLAPHLPAVTGSQAGWTAHAALPGGDFPREGFDALCGDLGRAFPFVDPTTMRRLARAYGTRTRMLLDGARTVGDLGRDFGAGLSEAELRYLRSREWATTAADVVWRRSKLGLHLTQDQIGAIDAALQ